MYTRAVGLICKSTCCRIFSVSKQLRNRFNVHIQNEDLIHKSFDFNTISSETEIRIFWGTWFFCILAKSKSGCTSGNTELRTCLIKRIKQTGIQFRPINVFDGLSLKRIRGVSIICILRNILHVKDVSVPVKNVNTMHIRIRYVQDKSWQQDWNSATERSLLWRALAPLMTS